MKLKLLTVISIIMLLGCTKEEDKPSFIFDSYSYLTHNSVLVKFKNTNDANEFPTGVRLSGRVKFSNDTVNYFNAIFSPIEMKYSVMLFDLLPDTKYTISFYYGHKFPSSMLFTFKTSKVEYFTDTRDGSIYPIGKIGNQWWLLENLNYHTSGTSGLPDSLLVGKYYTWEDAKLSCPQGWHLPSDEEWIELERYIGVQENVLHVTSQKRGLNEAMKLLTPTSFTLYNGLLDNSIVNELGYSLKACGYMPENRQKEMPQGFGMDGYYWSSSEFSATDAIYHGTAYKAYTGHVDSVFSVRLYMNKQNKMNIRCVKE
ncbi:MAG: FISUMP domain-containing protein [Tenuifilaceae bacterium]|nr:FISUMP domain-containing protein [Tenuifilaceae bacterium]